MKRILVIRNDKIGDFMLAWPSFAMLKASMPDCHITALVPRYTIALAELCPWIDDVLEDPTKKGSPSSQQALIEEIRQRHFDASINLFSTTYNALLVWKAKIPYRMAPATKLAQVFYNRRLKQKRSQSAKPEFEYNLDLIRAFLQDHQIPVVEPQPPYLTFSLSELAKQKDKLAAQLGICAHKSWVFVHAGSGGSANNLSLEQYRQLIDGMNGDFEVVLTAGPGEEEKAYQLQLAINHQGEKAVVYHKNDGLVDFARSIACASLFIAGSTGPLHIAAAIDVPTIGFFPAKRSATPLRWYPLNSQGRHLSFAPPAVGGKSQQEDMSQIRIQSLLSQINAWAATYLSVSKGPRISQM
ncbi:glycosyltransferase family 9 protein [Vibrio rhizosphaerae]|uniref:Glycosyltransferase family 9 protein n=1 Tax=Vibrio rhizosphaerae TaxID=398736 RepID=A0ABU4IQ65_9VIBR|nr:glycosyltransferase family 9 protein [Vibrio rhizosphaerae]MDW6091545.1 glycosyltransferase family 9 protein [Vibrio rhizosphaerae]